MPSTFRPGQRFNEIDGWQPPQGERSIFNTLGWRRVEVEAGRAVIEWEATADYAFRAGNDWIVQGGMVTAILDSAMGNATWTLLDHDEVFLTADLRTEFYRPARPGPVRATGWVVQKTRRVAFAAADLHDGAGVLLASGRASQVIIDIGSDPDRNRTAPAFPRENPSPSGGGTSDFPSPSGGGQGGG